MKPHSCPVFKFYIQLFSDWLKMVNKTSLTSASTNQEIAIGDLNGRNYEVLKKGSNVQNDLKYVTYVNSIVKD
jgi:hypothetical protein